MTAIVLTTPDLIAAIKAKLPEYRQRDAQVLAAHKQAELDKAAQFLAECKQAARLTPAGLIRKAKDGTGGSVGPNGFYLRGGCPLSVAASARRALKHLAITQQTRWTLTADGANRTLYQLVTFELEPESTDLCS